MGNLRVISSRTPPNDLQSRLDRRRLPAPNREPWQIQKDALKEKFSNEGWAPRKRLSPDALEGIRALHAQFPEKYTTPVLADQFEVSVESIRRILKSKWRPNDEETASRRARWDKRGERIWSKMVALGVKPPKKWREDFDTTANARYSPVQSPRQSSNISVRKGHRYTASLNRFNDGTTVAPESSQHDNSPPDQATINRIHRRSISIVSSGGDPKSSEIKSKGTSASGRPGRGHGRAASLQILPGRSTASITGACSDMQPFGSRVFVQNQSHAPAKGSTATSPATFRSSTSPSFDIKGDIHKPSVSVAEPAHSTVSSTPHTRTPYGGLIGSPSIAQIPPFPAKAVNQVGDGFAGEPFRSTGPSQNLMLDQPNQILTARSYLTKVFSSSSTEGTPRTSTDINSASNDSSDTLASAYVDTNVNRTSCPSASEQQQSCAMPLRSGRVPEILMMGYGNVVGSFNLDASLVKSSSFDGVKRKAVIGSVGGGGVVRAGSTKSQSGLLGSLGWNSLGESLGGLLGGDEMSSIKETTKANEAKWLPVLSTPQSLLFTDLRLEPGQSQSYSFSYRLPPGIPPSHNGKALRFSYNIVIGVQGATQLSQRHNVRTVSFPFRVLPGVDGHGNTTKHDLMSPRVILHKEPMIIPLSDVGCRAYSPPRPTSHFESPPAQQGFLSYIGQLLEMPHQDPSVGLLSPSVTEVKSPNSAMDEPPTVESAITLAIQQSNSPAKISSNRFEITKGGSRVAVIMLARPAYRLGEVIPMMINFHRSDIRCYSLHVTLESSERVDSTIALRSQTSISRVSRKVYATQYFCSISTDRMSINMAIPTTATPEFITSGISLDWCLRCEFVTDSQDDDGQGTNATVHDLLEEVAEDERGSVLAAIQATACETFDVQLPLRIYGDKRGYNGRCGKREAPI
ncbi:MAG: hypothetical protein Q9173_003893 [Seirophora scorigena]